MEVAAVVKLDLQKLKAFVSIEERKIVLLIPIWGFTIATIYAQALYQRAYLTLFDYLLVFGVCVIAGAIINDFTRALVGFVSAMIIGMAFLFVMTTLPALTNQVSLATSNVIFSIWTIALFSSVFPFPLLAYLIGSIIGSAIGEKYL